MTERELRDQLEEHLKAIVALRKEVEASNLSDHVKMVIQENLRYGLRPLHGAVFELSRLLGEAGPAARLKRSFRLN